MGSEMCIRDRWDAETKKKLDKDRFRRDMGGIEEAYKEILHRITKK